jgi:tetratricopeptide (TPR) repeat protein
MRRTSLVLVGLFVALSQAHGQQLAFLNRDLKDLQAWAREDTNDSQRQYYLALAHWKRHHWRETDSLLRLAIRMEPRYPEAYLALGYLPYARRTQLADEQLRGHVPDAWKPVVNEASSFYERAFRTDPMVNLEIMGIEIEEPKVLDYTLPVYQFYLSHYAWQVDLALGRYRLAHERLVKLAQDVFDEAKHPDKVPDFILWYRGLAAAHSLQYEAAIVDFRTLLERTLQQQQRDEIVHVPLNDNEYRFMLAALQRLAGHNDSAVALFQESLEHDLGLVMAHSYLATIYEDAGRADDALLERRRAAEVNTDDPAALFELAVSLFNTGNVRESVEQSYHAVALNARYAPPHYLLGRAAEAFGQPDQAREQYTQFLALAPLRSRDLRTDAQQRLDKLPK